ncbi:hypothetical protein V2J09_010300 [Rumex salicifolius]
MTILFRRLAKSLPIVFSNAYGGHGSNFKLPIGAIAALSGGFSFYCLYSSPSLAHLEAVNEGAGTKTALSPEEWIKFKLHETAKVNHNTKMFRFSFDPNQKLGMNVASCILTRASLGKDEYVIRPYTPISTPDAKGYFDLVVKIYPGGKMSQHLANLKPGDVLEVRGPIEKLKYTPNMKKHIGMIAGGTGITPMLQVIEEVLRNPDDNTQVTLLYANVSPDDILLKQRLDILASSHPNFKVYYTVSKASKDWKGGLGHVSKDMVVKGMPNPGKDTLIMVCGPPGMVKHVAGEKPNQWAQGQVSGLLKDVGYTEEMVYKF